LDITQAYIEAYCNAPNSTARSVIVFL